MTHGFVDEVHIQIQSGHGGQGCVAFRREKFVPYGGPNGGDGGKGGDVIFQADPNKKSLLDFRYRKIFQAQNGQPGGPSQCTGQQGQPCILTVPMGTMIFEQDPITQEETLCCDLCLPQQSYLAAQGGRGGKGNEHFKSASRQAPQYAQPGEPGIARSLRLELKLLANVGIIGFPNVGKSSLLCKMSAAKAKIAPYPFTTLRPNLGVVSLYDRQFIIADVPGLIVGAHQGLGLGTQFLRHVERVEHLVHLITLFPHEEPQHAIQRFHAIEAELHAFSPKLSQRPRTLVLNQVDLPYVAQAIPQLQQFAETQHIPFFALSAVSGLHVPEFIAYLAQQLTPSDL